MHRNIRIYISAGFKRALDYKNIPSDTHERGGMYRDIIVMKRKRMETF
jgi:hypothetical protein